METFPDMRFDKRQSVIDNIMYAVGLTFLTCCAYLAFNTFLFFQGDNDFLAHIHIARQALKDLDYPPHFLYHAALNILTFFSGDMFLLKVASLALNTLAALFKALLSLLLIQSLTENKNPSLSAFAKTLLVVILFFVSPVMNWWQYPRIFLGQFAPNIWHNPTVIMLMPFALAVMLCIEKEGRYQIKYVWRGGFLLMVSIFVKPNFAMAFVPAMLILSFLPKPIFRNILIYILPAALALGWQYFYAFAAGESVQSSSVQFNPLRVWLYHCRNPWGSLLVSFAFPAIFALCFGRRVKNHRMYRWAWALTLIALGQFFLLAEEGPRMYHANFYWGIVPGLYLLFLVSMVELALIRPVRLKEKEGLKYALCCLTLALHFISGILFYAHTVKGAGFYA